jgi:hypothetical protein
MVGSINSHAHPLKNSLRLSLTPTIVSHAQSNRLRFLATGQSLRDPNGMLGLDLAEAVGGVVRRLVINHLVVRSAKKYQVFIGVELLRRERLVMPGAIRLW